MDTAISEVTRMQALSPAPRRHQCTLCSRSFGKPEHLYRHERTHTGLKPFQCQECGKRFGRQDTLSRHAKVHQRSLDYDPFGQPYGSPSMAADDIHAELDNQALLNDDILNIPSAEAIEATEIPLSSSFSDHLTELWMPQLYTNVDPPAFGNWPEICSPEAAELPNVYSAQNLTCADRVLEDRQEPSDTFSWCTTFQSRGLPVALRLSRSISDLAAGLTTPLETSTIDSGFLETCLTMFFTRFIPVFPVIHTPDHFARECGDSLLLSIVALGSSFVTERNSETKGQILWRLAYTTATNSNGIVTICNRPQRTTGNPDVHDGTNCCDSYTKVNGPPNNRRQPHQLLMAAYFAQSYGLLSEDLDIRTLSQSFHAVGFQWARRSGLLEEVNAHVAEYVPPEDATPREKEELWKAWIEAEVSRRTILGYYVLDGLLTDITCQPTAVRHVSNQLSLPACDSAFEAKTVDEWISEMKGQESGRLSFKDVYEALFEESPQVREPRLSYLSIRVILEGIQSCVYEHREAGGQAIGTPPVEALRRALHRLRENHILKLPTKADIVEHEIRWHIICINLITNAGALCKQLCGLYGIHQDLILAVNQERKSDTDFSKWLDSPSSRLALLHAHTILHLVQQVSLGRSQCIHIPTAIFSAATIYAAALTHFSHLGRCPVVPMPEINWSSTWKGDENGASVSIDPTAMQFITDDLFRNGIAAKQASPRHLVHDLYTLQMLLLQISSHWGIANGMAKIVQQWTTSEIPRRRNQRD